MAKRGAERDYRSGQKNHWRRTIWNEVLRRTAGREKTECILYLAGPQDNDRRIAVEKGVPDRNLIALDVSDANVQSVRRNGGSAVKGDMLDALWSWPEDRPVCAVLMDFCSGIEADNLGVFDAFQRPCFHHAVGMVNFQRGRDAFSTPIRQGLIDMGVLPPGSKHRGQQFLSFHVVDWLSVVLYGGTSLEDRLADGTIHQERPCSRVCWPDSPAERATAEQLFQSCLASLQPSFYSYSSGSLMFDSAVFWHYMHFAPSLTFAGAFQNIRAAVSAWREAPLVRRIAATMAIRTQRESARYGAHG